jgi:hypothetical protein
MAYMTYFTRLGQKLSPDFSTLRGDVSANAHACLLHYWGLLWVLVAGQYFRLSSQSTGESFFY